MTWLQAALLMFVFSSGLKPIKCSQCLVVGRKKSSIYCHQPFGLCYIYTGVLTIYTFSNFPLPFSLFNLSPSFPSPPPPPPFLFALADIQVAPNYLPYLQLDSPQQVTSRVRDECSNPIHIPGGLPFGNITTPTLSVRT